MARKAANTVPAQERSIEAVIKKEIERQTKAGERKQTEWKVEGVPGLSVVLSKSGDASYHLRFMAGSGARRKQVRQAIGRARGDKSIGFGAARSKALAVATDGPSALGIEETTAEARVTLRALFEQFEQWNQRPNNDDAISPRTLADYHDQLERDVFTNEEKKNKKDNILRLGDVPVGEITTKDVAKLLANIERRSPNAAHKARAALGSLYKWAAKRFLVDTNIMLGMGFTHKNKPRDRIASDKEIKALWKAFDSDEFNATKSMRLLLKLTVLTGQRNSEVGGAKKTELHIGSNENPPYWHIPKGRMKRKDRDQFVFLSVQAVELFKEAMTEAGANVYVFPAKDSRSEHLAQDSVSHAFARACKLAKVESLTLHDMRKAITTWLGNQGERGDVLDRIQHHHSGHATGNRSSVTDTHYNFSVMAEPLRQAWQRWADHVWKVTGQAEELPSNVRELKRDKA